MASPDNIPTTVVGLMSLIIVVLAGVIVWQQKRIDAAYKEKDLLQTARLADSSNVRDKYDAVMGKFSQSFDLFVAKIEASGRKE